MSTGVAAWTDNQRHRNRTGSAPALRLAAGRRPEVVALVLGSEALADGHPAAPGGDAPGVCGRRLPRRRPDDGGRRPGTGHRGADRRCAGRAGSAGGCCRSCRPRRHRRPARDRVGGSGHPGERRRAFAAGAADHWLELPERTELLARLQVLSRGCAGQPRPRRRPGRGRVAAPPAGPRDRGHQPAPWIPRPRCPAGRAWRSCWTPSGAGRAAAADRCRWCWSSWRRRPPAPARPIGRRSPAPGQRPARHAPARRRPAGPLAGPPLRRPAARGGHRRRRHRRPRPGPGRPQRLPRPATCTSAAPAPAPARPPPPPPSPCWTRPPPPWATRPRWIEASEAIRRERRQRRRRRPPHPYPLPPSAGEGKQRGGDSGRGTAAEVGDGSELTEQTLFALARRRRERVGVRVRAGGPRR